MAFVALVLLSLTGLAGCGAGIPPAASDTRGIVEPGRAGPAVTVPPVGGPAAGPATPTTPRTPPVGWVLSPAPEAVDVSPVAPVSVAVTARHPAVGGS